jgi:hypothetical protein
MASLGSHARRFILLAALSALVAGVVALTPPAAALPPSNDDFELAEPLTGGSGTTTGTTVGATRELGEPAHEGSAVRTVWYSWTAPDDGDVAFDTYGSGSDTSIAAYTGTEVDDLAELAVNGDALSLESRITFDATEGTTYHVVVHGYAGRPIDFRLSWDQTGTAPVNDDLVDAIDLPWAEGTVEVDTSNATHEMDEDDHAAAGSTHSAWYTWTAPFTGLAVVNTEATFDEVVAVYEGTEVGDLTPLASGHDGTELEVAEGTAYAIAVDGAAASSGLIQLEIRFEGDPPANDDLADAQEIGTGSHEVTTFGATGEPDEPLHGGNVVERSVWFEWTAATDGPTTVELFGVRKQEWLAVYTGSSVATLQPVAAVQDGLAVHFDAAEGTTYLVAVDTNHPAVTAVNVGPSVFWFDDVPVDHPFWAEVEWMRKAGISEGYEDGLFHPASPVSRQAMAAFMHRFANGYFDTVPDEATFSDVAFNGAFFYEVEWMHDQGYSNGYQDGTYRPSVAVTRQAMAAFLHRYVGEDFEPPATATFDDVPTDHPFFLEVEWMAAAGISTGYEDDTFRPGAPVSRQAMSAFLVRIGEEFGL